MIILLPTIEPSAKNPDDFDAFMQWLDCQPRQIYTKEEIDRRIEEERNSWE